MCVEWNHSAGVLYPCWESNFLIMFPPIILVPKRLFQWVYDVQLSWMYKDAFHRMRRARVTTAGFNNIGVGFFHLAEN